MPTNSPEIKVAAVRKLGGEVQLVGESFYEAMMHALVSTPIPPPWPTWTCCAVLRLTVPCNATLCCNSKCMRKERGWLEPGLGKGGLTGMCGLQHPAHAQRYVACSCLSARHQLLPIGECTPFALLIHASPREQQRWY